MFNTTEKLLFNSSIIAKPIKLAEDTQWLFLYHHMADWEKDIDVSFILNIRDVKSIFFPDQLWQIHVAQKQNMKLFKSTLQTF